MATITTGVATSPVRGYIAQGVRLHRLRTFEPDRQTRRLTVKRHVLFGSSSLMSHSRLFSSNSRETRGDAADPVSSWCGGTESPHLTEGLHERLAPAALHWTEGCSLTALFTWPGVDVFTHPL